MLKKDFDLFKQRYLKECKTQSINPNVLEVYKLILENENTDSDYWNEDHGSHDLIRIFENSFTDNDWAELEKDLNNWTTFQLELFTLAIMNGYSSYTNNGIYYNDKETVKKLTDTIPNRFDLLLPIIQIEKERKLEYGDLSYMVWENLSFINDHFEILLEKDKEYLNKIQQIFELLHLSDSDAEVISSLKNKIQKASA